MVGLLYLYPNFTLFNRARRRLYEKWSKLAPFAIRVYEFRIGWNYGLVVFPLNNSFDPSKFIYAIQNILGDADKLVDSLNELPSQKNFLRSWTLGQDSLLNYMGAR